MSQMKTMKQENNNNSDIGCNSVVNDCSINNKGINALFNRDQNQSAIFKGRNGHVFHHSIFKNIAANEAGLGQTHFVERRNSEEFVQNTGQQTSNGDNRINEQKPTASLTQHDQNNFRQDYQYTRRNRRQRRGSHDFQASKKIEMQDDTIECLYRNDDRLYDKSRFEKKQLEKINNSDSQSFTDGNQEDMSIDESSDCECSSANQQCSQKLTKKNDSDASSFNGSSSNRSQTSSNKTSSEKIYHPRFKCVILDKNVDIDQKSQSSDSSTTSYDNKSAKNVFKKSQKKIGQAQKINNKRSHNEMSSKAANDAKMSSFSRVNVNENSQQPLVIEGEEFENLDDKEGILLHNNQSKGFHFENNLNKKNKRESKACQKQNDKQMPMPMRKKMSHEEKIYKRVDEDRDQDLLRDPYYPKYSYSQYGEFPVQSPELLINYNAIRINGGNIGGLTDVPAPAAAAQPTEFRPRHPLRPLHSSSSSSHPSHHHEHRENQETCCCCPTSQPSWHQQQRPISFKGQCFSFRGSSSMSLSKNDNEVILSQKKSANFIRQTTKLTTATETTATPVTQSKYTSVVKAFGKISNKQAYFQEILEKSKNLAKIFKGVVKTENQFSICKGQFSIRFNCQNEHNFFLPADKIKDLDLDQIKTNYRNSRLELQRIFNEQQKMNTEEQKSQRVSSNCPIVNLDIDSSCWCIRCLEYYNHCLASYNDKLLELVGGLFTKQVMYRCRSMGHIFYVSSVRKQKFQKQYRIQDYTCPECKKIEKENERRAAAEQEQHERKLLAEAQRELFEKTRIEMQQQEQEHLYSQMQNQQKVDERKFLQQQEKALNDQAKKMSIEFLTQQKSQRTSFDSQDASIVSREGNTADHSMKDVSGAKKASYDQVYLTYKFLITPLALLVKGMAKKTDAEVKRYYHKIAIQLHPDKNSHPQAKEAFQKIQNAVSEASKVRNKRGHDQASHSFAQPGQQYQSNFGFGYYSQHRF